MSDSKPVTQGECDRKHKITWKLFGVMTTALGLIIVGVGWAIAAGNVAQTDTSNVQLEFRVHMAQQAGEMGKVEMCLNRIEDICKENREELKLQRTRIETLMRVRMDVSPP